MDRQGYHKYHAAKSGMETPTVLTGGMIAYFVERPTAMPNKPVMMFVMFPGDPFVAIAQR